VSSKPLKDNLRKRTAADLREERDQLGGWLRQPEVRWLDPSILAKAGVEVASPQSSTTESSDTRHRGRQYTTSRTYREAATAGVPILRPHDSPPRPPR